MVAHGTYENINNHSENIQDATAIKEKTVTVGEYLVDPHTN